MGLGEVIAIVNRNQEINVKIAILNQKISSCQKTKSKYEKSKTKLNNIIGNEVSNLQDTITRINSKIGKTVEVAGTAISGSTGMKSSITEMNEEKSEIGGLRISDISDNINKQIRVIANKSAALDNEIESYRIQIRNLELQKK